jgi:DNA-binding NarL/FixJ family response regulator
MGNAPPATVNSKRVIPVTIVVADDDPDYRLLVRLILASASRTMAVIGEARDGEEALELVQRDRRPDIVISDLLMPRLNGIELTRRIKDRQPRTNVILLSAYTGEAYRRVASASGVDAFVSKQLVHSDLLPAIRDVIVRRVSEAVANRA